MKTISPELDAPQVRVAEQQPEYIPVTVALVADRAFPTYRHPGRGDGAYNAVVMAFQPTEEERARIAAGDDIYVSLLTFGRPQQGIIVTAGKEAMAGYYHVGVRPTEPVGSGG